MKQALVAVRRPRPRTQWVWWVLVALILGLGFWWPFDTLDHRTDSFNSEPTGTKAFYRLVRELLPEVGQHASGSLAIASDVDTICLVGPARVPSPAEWRLLYDWVVDGGSLFFACRTDDPAVDLGPFEIRVQPVGEGLEGPVETELVSGAVEWSSRGEIVAGGDARVLVTRGGRPQVVSAMIESGVVVVCASSAPFSNAALGRGSNGEFAFRIFEECRTNGRVVFDESLNSGGPAVIGLLFAPPFRLFSLQLILLLVHYWWRGFYRFGPPQPSLEGARRNFADHALGLARLYARGTDVRPLAQAHYEHFRRGLGFHRVPRPDLIARRAGVPIEDVTAWLDELAAPGPMKPKQGARWIRRMNRLNTRPSAPSPTVGSAP